MTQMSIFDAVEQVARPVSTPLSASTRSEGRARARAGAELSADKADCEHEGWKVAAYSFLLAYGRKHGGVWQTEDVRHASVGHIHAPSNPRAWGQVVLKAKRAGLIEFAGFTTSRDPKSHCAPSTSWKWIGEREVA